MIRWSYVAPRLAVVVGAYLALTLLLPLGVRWTLNRAGQATFGDRFQVSQVRTKLFQGRFEINGVELPRSGDSRKNSLKLESAVLDVDLSQLAHGRFVADRAEINGIQADSDDMTEAQRGRKSALSRFVRKRTAELLATLADLSVGHTEESIKQQSKAIKEIELLVQKWPAQYDEFRERAKLIIQQSKGIRQLIDKNDPLRSTVKLTDQLLKIREAIESLQRDYQNLEKQIEVDKQNVEAAIEVDIAFVKRLSNVDSVDVDAWANLFLGETLADYAVSTQSWAAKGLALIRMRKKLDRIQRARGTTFEFNGPEPRWMIRRLLVNGSGTHREQPFDFALHAANVSDEPESNPVSWKLQGTGALSFQARGEWSTPQNQWIELWTDKLPRRSKNQTGGVLIEMASASLISRTVFRPGGSSTELTLKPKGVRFAPGDTLEAIPVLGNLLADKRPAVDLTIKLKLTTKGDSVESLHLESDFEERVLRPLQVELAKSLESKAMQLEAKWMAEIRSQLQLVKAIEFESSEEIRSLLAESARQLTQTTQLTGVGGRLRSNLTEKGLNTLQGILKR